MAQTPINLTHLPASPPTLFGRAAELAQLDTAWSDSGCGLLCVAGEEGVGKSSLLTYWVERHFLPARQPADSRVYGWSFYNQGSMANQTVAADFFIYAALKWFGDPDPSQGSAWDKGRRLAGLIRQSRTLLVLAGLELLQIANGPGQGKLQDPAVQALLHELSLDNPGLGLISTCEPVVNLGQPVPLLALEPLSDEAGAALLKNRGLNGTEAELRPASRAFGGHPLALAILASYVGDALGGDIHRLAEIPPLPEDGKPGGQTRRLLQAYEAWFGDSPEQNILRLLGLFMRPTETEALETLLVPPAIPGLTGQLFIAKEKKALGFLKKKEDWPITRQAWQTAVDKLRRANLLLPARPNGPAEADRKLDAHPLVRKYFARQLGNKAPQAWFSGHERLYRYFGKVTEQYPDTLEDMTLLYTAVVHGCRADKFEEALDEIYWERIARKQDFFTTTELGIPGADLATLANFYRETWREPARTLSRVMQATLLNWTGSLLRTMGRLEEAQEALQAAAEIYRTKKVWKQAALVMGNLSQVNLLLGDLPAALASAQECIKRAIRSRDQLQQMMGRAAEADALHQAGRLAEAEEAFAEVEKMQRRLHPQVPFLYSLRGYHYCDLLLSRGEFEAVIERAGQTLEIAEEKEWRLYVALDHLSLGRAYLAQSVATCPIEIPITDDGNFQKAGQHYSQAIEELRRERSQDFIGGALLARADWYCRRTRSEQAQTDITEAMTLANRTGMKLLQVDAHLAQARLETVQKRPDKAQLALQQAKALIKNTGYHRRNGEIAALEAEVSY